MSLPPLISFVPTLIFPGETRFPFDNIAIKIIEALYERNWQAPGIKVEFNTFGHGRSKWIYVNKVIGYGPATNAPDISNKPPKEPESKDETELFILKYGRSEGQIDEFYCHRGGIHEMIFREEQLTVYCDNSGPTYKLYVGPGSPHYPPNHDELNKEAERIWYLKLDTIENQAKMPSEEDARKMFMYDILANMRLNHEPRIALLYSNNGYEAALNKNSQMINDPDLERNYRALPSEPQKFSTFKMYDHFTERLQSILDRILETPPATEIDRYAFYHPEPLIPIETIAHPLEEMYALVNHDTYERILKGQIDDASQLQPLERYAIQGTVRLAPLSVKGAPEAAYNGFCWCGHLRKSKNGTPDYECLRRVLDVSFYWPDQGVREYNYGLVKISPRYANDCYVADSATYLRAREEMFHKISPRDRLTDEELDIVDLVRAKTIVPLVDYDGTYKQPFLLISREIDFDEVQPIGFYSKPLVLKYNFPTPPNPPAP